MLLGPMTTAVLGMAVGNVLPAYRTFKALQTDSETETNEASVRWLQYWIVFALFSIVEYVLDMFGSWFPLYYELKLTFLLWLTLDRTMGATVVYNRVIEPLLISKQTEIDAKMEFVADRAKNIKIEDVREFVDWATAKGSELVDSAKAAGQKGAPPAPPAPPAEQAEKPVSDDEDKK